MIRGLDAFVDALSRAGLDPTIEEIRDALWLSTHIVVTEAPPEPAVTVTAPPGQPAAPDGTEGAPTARYLEVAPQAAAESAPIAEMYAAGGDNAAVSMHGMAVRSPAVSALRHKATLIRALRPLKRTASSTTTFVVDENATAEQVALEGLWLPVLRPAPERWLDLTLVVDTAASMVVWHRTIAEFRTLAEQLGAFRRIRAVELNGDDTGVTTVELECHTVTTTADPATLIDPAERQVILVITDGVGNGWRCGRIQTYLQRWAQHASVAVATVLPQRMWAGSGLKVFGGQAWTWRAGVPNAQWNPRANGDAPIPVVGLSARWLKPWAQLVTGAGGRHNTALMAMQPRPAGTSALPQTRSAKDIVNVFRSTASPTAFQLACYLSAAWLNPPVMRLVQHLMLPDSEVSHLAEVFLGGLLRRVGDGDTDPDFAQYDFAPGVRDELLSYLNRDEMLAVVERSSQFVAERFGQAFDFAALLADPEGVELPAVAGAGGMPLAHVSASVLAKLGGRYQSLSQRVETAVQGSSGTHPVPSGSAVISAHEDAKLAQSESSISASEFDDSSSADRDTGAHEPAAAQSYLIELRVLVTQPETLSLDRQRQIVNQLAAALRSTDLEEQRAAREVLDVLSRREDLYAVVDRAITQLSTLNDELELDLSKALPVSDIDSSRSIDDPIAGRTAWVSRTADEFWEDLLSHLQQQVLVPVVGADVTVVADGEQTFDTLIGQRLSDFYSLAAPPGQTTMSEAVAAFLRERGPDELERLYRVINDIIVDLDLAPGDALRNLAAIDDFRLFVTMTPDRLLAKAINEARFHRRPLTREISFSPNQSARDQTRNAKPPKQTDTVVLSLFGQAAPTPQYAIHEEDRLEWLHALLSDEASLPDWLASPLKHQPMLFIGCEMSDWLGRLLLRIFSPTRLSLERAQQFFFVGSPGSQGPGLSDFIATYSRKTLVQQLDMQPTAFVAELRARWEEEIPAKTRLQAAAGPLVSDTGTGTIFISYIREDEEAVRRLSDAITSLGGDVWFDGRRMASGDSWEQEVLVGIRQSVRLFIPVISMNTESLDEGYIFREWIEATARSRTILGRRFIVPVIIDSDYEGDPSRYRRIPEEFGYLQFGHAPAGKPDAGLLQMLTSEIRAMRRTSAS